MNCPICGFSDGTAATDPVCPRCSLRQAIASEAAADSFAVPPEESTAVAGYELVRPIGRGAMGTVWLARERRLDRLVALKLIPHGGDPGLAERLLREGRAAAQLSHPHIVAIYALGGSGSSTFLAMEFQAGGNLAEQLQGKSLAPRAVAELGVKLAGALAHAHGAGILHRDLKPSNVLINAEGEPLLGDFGLAGPLDGRGDLTRAGEFGGTPAFVAPELLEGPDRASARSDGYGLGVVLYVALTGRLPFAADSTAAVLREISILEPPAPRILSPGIPRDLETIVLKCLEKAPARRYESAAALRDDLRRYLAGETILARPVGPGEKAVRWCRRRPAAAAALALGGLVILLLAVGGPLVAWKLDRSRRAAEEAAATATAISDFLRTDLLAQASPNNQPDRDLKLRTVLDQASAKVERRFADRPEVEGALQQTLGETYFALGELGAARKHFDRALQLRLPSGGAPRTREARLTLNAIASTLYLEGKLAESAAIFRRVAESGARPTKDDTTAVEALGNWGLVTQKLGLLSEGLAITERALAISSRIYGPDHPETLTLKNNLVGMELVDGNYAQAAELEAQVLAVRTRVSGPDHPDTVTVLGNLAFLYRMQQRLSEAEAAGRQVVAVRRRVSGPDHIYTLVASADLAQTLKAEGKLAEAEALVRPAAEAATRTLGPAHPQTELLAEQWGELLLLLHRPQEAERVLRAAWEARPAGGAGDWKRYLLESRWGEALAELGQRSEASQALAEAAAGLQSEASKLPPWKKFEVGLAQERAARFGAAGADRSQAAAPTAR